MKRYFRLVSIILLLSVSLIGLNAQSVIPSAPVAKIVPKYDTLHGDIRVDNYFWIRDVDRTNPDVLEYLKAENTFTESIMKPTEAFQETLYNEMVRRIKETDQDPAYPDGEYYYYTRTEKGKQYPIYCRRKGNVKAAEEVYFDQNEISKGYKFYRLNAMELSPDHNLLAFSVDTNAWAMDNKTIFYTAEDSAKRPFRLFKHILGSDASADQLLFEEKNEMYNLGVGRTRSDKYILVQSSASNSDEWQYIPADQPNENPKMIIPRSSGHEYSVDHHSDYFYIRTNKNAETFRLVKAPISDPSEKNWIDVIPYRRDVTVEGMDFFQNYSVIYEREKGLQNIFITELNTGDSHFIEFPDPVYTAYPSVNRVFDTKIFRYSYQSLTTPASIYDYGIERKEAKLLKQQEVVGGYDPTQYKSERVYAKAPDGVEVPISLVYKKGVKLDGTAPLHMTGYGSYGSPSQPTFSSSRLSYLNRGIIFAIAHVRGGGDMGKEWYEDGKLLKKKNTFTDFISCAEYLIKEEYTSKEKLTISGGSAGGLLMGAVTTMRPDLFKAVIASVPFVDVINTMLDPTLMYTTTEYLEWGNPNDKIYYDYMKSYDPYNNVKTANYPNILVKVGLNDPRVNYWEGTKWAAKLRAMKTDKNLVLVKVNMGAGHMGSSGRYERLKEASFDYTYILNQYGIGK
jgi:oligopeptidase B